MIGFELSGSLWTTTLLTFVTYRFIVVIYNLTLHPLRQILGPWTWSATRLPFHIALVRGTIIHDIQSLHKKYGPVLRIAPNEVTFAHPNAYAAILQPRPGQPQFLKHPLWWAQMRGQPVSLLSAIDPGKHAQIKRVLSPAFTTRALRGHGLFIQRHVNLLVQLLMELVMDDTRSERAGQQNENKENSGREKGRKRNAKVNMTPWFTTFDIFGDLGFGKSFDCLEHSRYHSWVLFLFEGVKAAAFIISTRYHPLLDSLLIKCVPPSLRRVQQNHFQQIIDKVNRRLNWELSRPDVMSFVLDEEGNSKLPDGELQATFSVLITAGSETSATALTGSLNFLVQTPDYAITLDALRDLPYLNAVLHEGLRLCPPIPRNLPRLVPEGGRMVCGVWLPDGIPVSIQAYSLNRSPKYFHNATTFIPERWLKSVTTDPNSPFNKDTRHAVQPFSIGPRSCIGQDLAWAELRLILAKLVWSFELETVKGEEIKWEELRTFLLIERKPVNVRLTLRAGGLVIHFAYQYRTVFVTRLGTMANSEYCT
ncbi:cytochrome P450 [Aspergillus venezuelensis]